METIDNSTYWGNIFLDSKFTEVIQTKEFKDQAYKLHLGIPNFTENKTRLVHALGVFHLAGKLMSRCETLCNGKVDISPDDKNAVLLFGLLHDIGHAAHSHSSEDFLNGDHEMRAITMLVDSSTEIHQCLAKNFGPRVIKKVMSLIRNSEKDSEFLDIVQPMLSGPEDIDRMEYMYTDPIYSIGKQHSEDFSDLLDVIQLEHVDGKYKIVYPHTSIDRLKDFHRKRFDLYDSIYYSTKKMLLEEIYSNYAKCDGVSITWDDDMYSVNSQVQKHSNCVDCLPVNRCADLIVSHEQANIPYYYTYIKEDYLAIIGRLYEQLPELKAVEQEGNNCCLYTCSRKMKLYNNKYSTYIKYDSSRISTLANRRDFNQLYQLTKYLVAVDLEYLATLTATDYNDLLERYNLAVYGSKHITEEHEMKKILFS